MTTYQDNAAIIEREEVLQGEGSRVIDVDFSKTDTSSVKSVPLYGEPGFEEYARSLDTRSIGYRVIKRSFDLVFSCIVIVLAFIPLLILSIFIAIDTKAFPVYSHERIGHRGAFNFYKLRSMVKDSDDVEKHFTPEQLEQWNKEHKVDDDPRVTKLGAFLRRTSLDELPQFFNVALGQLSVIGPRCVTRDELKWYGKDVAKLLSVPQGITGAWQIGERNKATYENGTRQAIELNYCCAASFGLDVKIFLATFAAMFINRTGQ